jgi:hypothetical protein
MKDLEIITLLQTCQDHKGVSLVGNKFNWDIRSEDSYFIGMHNRNILPYIERSKWCLA